MDPSIAAARQEVVKYETEIKSIKEALRNVSSSSSSDSSDTNTLEIVLLKVEGLPTGAKPNLTVQLSSPIEEGTLAAVNDTITFNGVETNVATLIVSAKDADIPLGSSSPHDVAPLCTIDPLNMKDKYETELPVAIVSEDGSSATTSATAAATVDTTDAGGKNDDAAEATATVAEVSAIQPICTVTLKVTFKPTSKDQRNALYEQLNKSTRNKSEALQNLSKVAMAAQRNSSSSSPSKDSGTVVKSGFLNAKSKKEEEKESTLQKLYTKTFGPDSLLRRGSLIVFAFKDYLIFFGAVGLMHFKGNMLALPPPV